MVTFGVKEQKVRKWCMCWSINHPIYLVRKIFSALELSSMPVVVTDHANDSDVSVVTGALLKFDDNYKTSIRRKS